MIEERRRGRSWHGPVRRARLESEWVGAVVEVDGPDMFVEQTYVGANGDTDRAPCLSRTNATWVVADGATRVTEFGEEMTLLILNPVPRGCGPRHLVRLQRRARLADGVDNYGARRVVRPTSRRSWSQQVSAVIDVRAGRVAVSRVQVVDGGADGVDRHPCDRRVLAGLVPPRPCSAATVSTITVVNPSSRPTPTSTSPS
ncbi:MAG: hypothetical protein R2695_03650 [Acidimicrobiales bacterium]